MIFQLENKNIHASDSGQGININKDCGSTNPEFLREEVLKGNYDLGIAFDGDGDRILVVSKEGQILDGDDLIYVLSHKNSKDKIFRATKNITRKDGSLEEAFPNEGSYCVTALVAFDLLCTLHLLRNFIDEEIQGRWLKVIKPLIGFLIKKNETAKSLASKVLHEEHILYPKVLLNFSNQMRKREL